MAEQVGKGNQKKAEDQRDQCALGEAFFDAVNFSGADVLPRISGERGTQGTVGLLDDLLHAVRDGKRRHHSVAEAVYHALEHHTGDGDHGILQGHRHAEAERFGDDCPVRSQFFLIQTKVRYPAVRVEQAGCRRDGLGDDGGERHAEDAQAERQHKGEIQHHIDDTCQNQKIQGCSGIAKRTQDGGGPVVKSDADDPGTGGPHVGDRVADDVVRRREKPQQRRSKKNTQCADHKRRRDQDIERVRDGAAHVFLILGSEVLRHDDADADREAGAQRKEQKVHGAAGPDRRQGVLAHKIPHNDRIHHVVKLLEKVADQQRQGKFQDVPCRAADGHVGYVLGVHGFLSGRERDLSSSRS